MDDLTYAQKKAIADSYLMKEIGLGWDDLPDINSLHDSDTEEEIIALCDNRLAEEGMIL